MAQENSFDELIARLRAGDESAAQQLFDRFIDRLIQLARSRMDRALRQKVDAEDVVQSVFKSFFRRQAEAPFALGNWDDLWSLLVVITLRKCVGKIRRFHGKGRDVRKEAAGPFLGDDAAVVHEAVAREPTPAEAAMLTETVEHMMRGLGEHERQVFEMRLQGYMVAEISARTGRSEYTVEGMLKRIRKMLKKLLEGNGAKV